MGEIEKTPSVSFADRPKTLREGAKRLTKWEGRDEDGPRAVLIQREGPFAKILQPALRKLARYEDMEEEDAEQLHQKDDEIIRHHTEEARDEDKSR